MHFANLLILSLVGCGVHKVVFEMVLDGFIICKIKLLISIELKVFSKNRHLFNTSLFLWQALSVA